jgi:hypothetical protein
MWAFDCQVRCDILSGYRPGSAIILLLYSEVTHVEIFVGQGVQPRCKRRKLNAALQAREKLKTVIPKGWFCPRDLLFLSVSRKSRFLALLGSPRTFSVNGMTTRGVFRNLFNAWPFLSRLLTLTLMSRLP